MKIHRILCLGAAILVPELAGAKLPLSNDAFGKLEGSLDFCVKADPQGAEKLQEIKKQTVKGSPRMIRRRRARRRSTRTPTVG